MSLSVPDISPTSTLH